MLRSISSSRSGRLERFFLRLSVARWRARSAAVDWRELLERRVVQWEGSRIVGRKVGLGGG